jgi:hypothetical protein
MSSVVGVIQGSCALRKNSSVPHPTHGVQVGELGCVFSAAGNMIILFQAFLSVLTKRNGRYP